MSDQTHTLRVALWPDKEIVVDDNEYHSLLRQGLVLTEPAAPDGDAGDQPDPAQVAKEAAPTKPAGRKAADPVTSDKD